MDTSSSTSSGFQPAAITMTKETTCKGSPVISFKTIVNLTMSRAFPESWGILLVSMAMLWWYRRMHFCKEMQWFQTRRLEVPPGSWAEPILNNGNWLCLINNWFHDLIKFILDAISRDPEVVAFNTKGHFCSVAWGRVESRKLNLLSLCK